MFPVFRHWMDIRPTDQSAHKIRIIIIGIVCFHLCKIDVLSAHCTHVDVMCEPSVLSVYGAYKIHRLQV